MVNMDIDTQENKFLRDVYQSTSNSYQVTLNLVNQFFSQIYLKKQAVSRPQWLNVLLIQYLKSLWEILMLDAWCL